MEGRDSTHPDRSSPVKNGDIRNPRSGAADSLSNEWTDEKHNMFLSSIEATFVNQLYGREHLSSNLMCWLSRTQKKTNPSQSNPNKQHFGQFKVLRQGCWEDYKFDRAKSRAVTENEACHTLANSWVQRFKSSIGKHPQPSVDVDNNDFSSRSINLKRSTDVKKTLAKQIPACYPLMFHQDSVSSRAEVTDQNFVDTDPKLAAEEPSKSSSKKRSRRSAHSKINDQIVPCNSVATSSGNFLKENEAEFSSTIRKEKIHEPYFYNHEEPEGLGFNNG